MSLSNWLARRRAARWDLRVLEAQTHARLYCLTHGVDPDTPGIQGPPGVQGPPGIQGPAGVPLC